MAKVAVVKCSSYDYDLVFSKVSEAINLIGGFELKKGAKVLVKPNLLGDHKPEDAVTTHPFVVEAVVRILKEKGADITIGDSCGMGVIGGTRAVLETTGMNNVAKKHNIKALALETKTKVITDNNAKILKTMRVSSIAEEADLIINLPKLKTHSLMRYTGAVKNIFGIIPGGNKPGYHSTAPREDEFGNLLVDIYQNFTPELSIMDGIVGIEGNGPGSGGIKKQAGIILASKDAVCLDIVASKIIGFEPLEIRTTKYAIERGVSDGKAEIVGEANLSIPFKKPITAPSFVPDWVSKRIIEYIKVSPHVIKEKCLSCRTCFAACPVHAISMDKKARIDNKKCINCFCCHELCPYKAIELRQPLLLRVLVMIRRMIKL